MKRSRHRAGVTGVLTLALAGVAPGCAKQFDGPFPCKDGYASCSSSGPNVSPNSNLCETNITGDPQNCGSCGSLCQQGALCLSSRCTQSPPMLAAGVDPAVLEMNSANLYFWSQSQIGNASGTLTGLSKNGGTPFSVQLLSDWQTSNQTQPFAVDDMGVYYAAQSNSTQGPPTVGIDAVPPDGSGQQPTVVTTFPNNGTNSANGSLATLVLVGPTLFLAAPVNSGGPNELAVFSVPESGGALTMVATLPTNNNNNFNFNLGTGFAFDASNFYFVSTNGGCSIQRLPLTGGSPSTFVSTQNQGGCPNVIASDGTRVYWTTNYSGCPNNDCGNNNNGNNNNGNGNNGSYLQCNLSVYMALVNGGSPTTLAQLVANEEPLQMVADGSSVYFVTDESVWKVPATGGNASRIAGNLNVSVSNKSSASSSGAGCTFGGGAYNNGQGSPASLAVDSTSVYLAISSMMAGSGISNDVLFKIPK